MYKRQQPLLQAHHKKALILGTGGASKAVYHGLKNLGIESVFVSRTHKADGMRENQKFPEPIVTPTTKAEMGLHDEDISKEEILKQG